MCTGAVVTRGAHAAPTVWRWVPNPSMRSSTTSPGARYGAPVPSATPAGVPVFTVDARRYHDARALMAALAAMLEMQERLGEGTTA